MKHNNIIAIAIGLVLCVLSTNAKNSYYYYNGNRIPLLVSEDSISVYTKDGCFIRETDKAENDSNITSIFFECQ